MTNQKYIEEIRKVCIKANPEILELKFGCRIGNERKYRLEYVGFNNRQHCLALWKDGEQSLLFVDNVKQEEILGRPITLADVLLTIAFGKTVGFIRTDTGLIEIDQNPSELLSLWNLKENLENQSEETIEWLYKLTNKE